MIFTVGFNVLNNLLVINLHKCAVWME